MKFDAVTMVGNVIQLAKRLLASHYSPARTVRFSVAAALLIVSSAALAQALYKYRGDDGEWIYTDRAPDENQQVEVRDLPQGIDAPSVHVSHRFRDEQIQFSARNDFHAPVEVILALDKLDNVGSPSADKSLRWVLPARSQSELLRLDMLDSGRPPSVNYRYIWLPGDPSSVHDPERPYRAPFAIAKEFTISQAYPMSETHVTPDSRYAVDIAMPVGSGVYAARAGRVVEVASTNYRGGFDTSRDGAEANIIRVLHEDGTFAIYAHLNWNSIRVQPGDIVTRGEYIADSGNTGFSTGPHLHFAVLSNKGLRMESLPVEFAGPSTSAIIPEAGIKLTAH